jgi:uncharacterized damage-inducible protein DinB
VPDRPTPFALADEKQTLRQFLDYLRECVIAKAEGLDDEAVRRPLVPSGTSLLGLVSHLAVVEAYWFQWAFAGLDVELSRVTPDSEAAPASVIAAYREAVRRSNEVIDGCDDVDRTCVREGLAPQPMSMRWLLVHMVEETARHAGHADIVREQIDGETGR